MNITGYIELPVRDNSEPLITWYSGSFTSETYEHEWWLHPLPSVGESYSRTRVGLDASKNWTGVRLKYCKYIIM